MVKKFFVNREHDIPSAQVPFVRRQEPDTEIASSSSRNSSVTETTVQLPFRILDDTSNSFPKFNATGRSMIIKFRFRAKSKNL